MRWSVEKAKLAGEINIPASKSHTIRALLIATLAKGDSYISDPLLTGDGESALVAAKALGATVSVTGTELKISGCGKDVTPADSVFMGNSGTGTRLFTTAAALTSKTIEFDGDSSLRSRPMLPLLKSIESLGGKYNCSLKEGYLPYSVTGPVLGGEVTVDGTTSQYLSSLLLTAPLFENDTKIIVNNLNEKPYVEMTLWWLDKMGIEYSADFDNGVFTVSGNQSYSPISEAIPADFSSATFSAVAAAISGTEVRLRGVDFTDPQGDKGVFEVLERMGAKLTHHSDGITVNAKKLTGIEIDLNSMPDALPALSVLGTVAEGETRIVNVAQARIKETDRIEVMCKELKKMGADIEEREDGLVIRKSSLVGTNVDGHDDHRIVMALTLAGSIADGVTTVDTVEAADVTYPSFARDFRALGAKISESFEG
jgi:3-phosphoshikimate 1-carboxyvinyltransferase